MDKEMAPHSDQDKQVQKKGKKVNQLRTSCAEDDEADITYHSGNRRGQRTSLAAV